MLKGLFSRKPALDADQTVQQAWTLQEQGRLNDAEPLCRAVLAAQPDHFDALHLLGLIKLQQGQVGEAESAFAAALARNPNAADTHTNRGAALLGLNRAEDALASFERALAVEPSAHAHFNRAAVLNSLGRAGEAIAGFTSALAVQPDHFEALAGLGNAFNAQDRIDDALALYSRALAVRPDSATTRNDRATALNKLGRHAEALAELDLAIALDPENAGAPYNRGVILQALGRLDEAIAAYNWACAIKPDFVQALCNRGNVERERNRHDDALASYEQVLAIDPDYPFAAGNVAFERAQLCLWDDRDRINARVMDGVARGKPVCAPLTMLALVDDAGIQRACAQIHAAHQHPLNPRPLWTSEVYRHDRIRVAYVSADFHEHALAFLIAGMLEQHDHRRFEFTWIAIGPDIKGPMRSRIEVAFDRIVDARNLSDDETARVMRELEIEIAVDLMGFTRRARTGIFACRPAPIQVNYLGYPGTMGTSCVDYILADPFVIPEARRRNYAESIVYLPDTFQANDSMRCIADATPSRAAVGLPPEGFVFCSFNSNYKITPEMFGVWMRIVARTPGSVLWLIGANDSVQANLRREAQQRDVAPERLVFAPRLPYAEHLARYRLAGLFLDTLPFNGGATTSDALWAGLPVVTCTGDAFAARMAGSLLQAVGLPELITHTMDDYAALALQLAADPPRLAGIRQTLARNRDTMPLFDTDRFRRNVEAAYVTMWEKCQRGERPDSFAVPG